MPGVIKGALSVQISDEIQRIKMVGLMNVVRIKTEMMFGSLFTLQKIENTKVKGRVTGYQRPHSNIHVKFVFGLFSCQGFANPQ